MSVVFKKSDAVKNESFAVSAWLFKIGLHCIPRGPSKPRTAQAVLLSSDQAPTSAVEFLGLFVDLFWSSTY